MMVGSTQNGREDGVGIVERLEDGRGVMGGEVVDAVPSGGYTDGANPECTTAVDIGRRIADDHHAIPRHRRTEERLRATLRHGRQLRTFFVIAAKRPDTESFEIHAHRAQFPTRPRFDIAREQPEGCLRMRIHRIEQRQHAAA